MRERVLEGEATKQAFERDGFLILDPGIPERTIDDAVADAESGPPRVGTRQRPHSDQAHFNSEPSGVMRGVVAAMEDIDELPYVSPAELGIEVGAGQRAGSQDAHVGRYEPYLERVIAPEQLEPRVAPLRRGQAIVWAARLGRRAGDPSGDPSCRQASRLP